MRTTVATVLRLIEGAVLVILLLSLFLDNIRAAFIVALTVPLSLLFAFIFMDLRGIPANLLSLGAIDFGIIVDGAVIMTENIMRHLSERKVTGHRILREVQHAAVEVARPLTFAVLIIMTVYVPILTFQRIEGKLFRPMAVTISLAVVGSLLLTLTLIPVLSSLLFRHPPSERESPILRWLRRPVPRPPVVPPPPRHSVVCAAVRAVLDAFTLSAEVLAGPMGISGCAVSGGDLHRAVRPYVHESATPQVPQVRVGGVAARRT